MYNARETKVYMYVYERTGFCCDLAGEFGHLGQVHRSDLAHEPRVGLAARSQLVGLGHMSLHAQTHVQSSCNHLNQYNSKLPNIL